VDGGKPMDGNYRNPIHRLTTQVAATRASALASAAWTTWTKGIRRWCGVKVQQDVENLYPIGSMVLLPSGYVKIAIENGPVEIVDFPIENGGSFHSYVSLPEGIYGNIYHQYTPVMLAYIPAPWILWVWFLLGK